MIIYNNTQNLAASLPATTLTHDTCGSENSSEEQVICEHFILLRLNGEPLCRLSCTPSDLTELVIGRLFTEQLIKGTADIDLIDICKNGNTAEIILKNPVSLKASDAPEPTCCTANKQFLALSKDKTLKKLPDVKPDSHIIFEMAAGLKKDTGLHRLTGGAHSCSIRFPDGTTQSFEDIGRHNAIDKAVGCMLIREQNPADCMLFTTGRVSSDMAEKVISAGIPVLISKAVPTDKALIMAKEFGLKLFCRAWPDSYKQFNI